MAARHGMRELLARAHVYRARLGQAGARSAAEELSAEIDNPHLAHLLGHVATDPLGTQTDKLAG
jgi:hypothetical protein